MKKPVSKIDRIGWRFDNTYARLSSSMLTKMNPVPVKKPEIIIMNNNTYVSNSDSPLGSIARSNNDWANKYKLYSLAG